MSKLVVCPNTETSPSLRMSKHGSCHEMIWEKGHFINKNECDVSNLHFYCETMLGGTLTDYAVSDMGCPVVSEKLKSVLESGGIDNIEYLAASISKNPNDPPTKGYFAANIIGLVDCIDKEASEMDAEENDDGELNIIYSIDKLVLKDMPVPAYIYRVFSFRRLILLDDKFKSIIEENGITGIRLVEPERWDGIYGEI